jgi:hypothetical protein
MMVYYDIPVIVSITPLEYMKRGYENWLCFVIPRWLYATTITLELSHGEEVSKQCLVTNLARYTRILILIKILYIIF